VLPSVAGPADSRFRFPLGIITLMAELNLTPDEHAALTKLVRDTIAAES